MFYGTSGGGFASICLGTLIKKSKVLVNNPQLNVLSYYSGHIADLFRVLKNMKEFSRLSEPEIKHEINYRLNAINLFKKMDYMPPITYYINIESDADLNKQFLPFINNLKENSFTKNELEVHFYSEKKNNPHYPLNSEKSKKLIKSFAKQHLYNDK